MLESVISSPRWRKMQDGMRYSHFVLKQSKCTDSTASLEYSS